MAAARSVPEEASRCHSSSRSIRARPARARSCSITPAPCARVGAAGIPADLPAAGLGRARRRRRSGRRSRGVHARGAGQGRHRRRATSPRSASPTSARRRSCGSARPGRPIANAIVWQDRRTAPHVRRAARGGPRDDVRARRPASSLDAYFSGTKLEWLLDNVPGARARARRGELAFGTIDAWLDLEPHRRRACT